VPVGGQISVGEGVHAAVTQSTEGVLLLDGRPAYQFVRDSNAEAATGHQAGNVWFWFEASPGCQGDCDKESLDPTDGSARQTTPAPSDVDSPTPAPNPAPRPPPSSSGTCPSVSAACAVPAQGQDWVISESCSIQAGTYAFRKVTIADGAVVIVESGASVEMELTGGLLLSSGAELWIGCEAAPFTGQWLLTFKGQPLDLTSRDRWLAVDYADYGLPQRSEIWANALVAGHGSRLEIHGTRKTSWTRLRANVAQGSRVLELQESAENWLPGDEIVIAKSGRDGGSERATIQSVDGDTVTLRDGLAFAHDGSWPGRGAPLNSEVGVLSRNVKFTSDYDERACEIAFGNQFSRPADSAKQVCFGGNMAFLQHSVVHIENAEFHKMGQGLAMGRYALHFHLAGDADGSYLRDNAIHSGPNRCMVLHGAFNVELAGNVCVDNRGHNIYLEDGIEWGNRVVGNLVVNPKSSATICSDQLDNLGGPAGLWITNPDNTFTDNAVIGAAFGAWFTFPTADNGHPFSASKRGELGGVFGASRSYFADPASGYGPESWVMRQEQARTPATAFHRNVFKDSVRMGIIIDFRVYDSEDSYIPCLEKATYTQTSCPTCPTTAHTFSWGPATFDKQAAPEARRYQPARNTFEDIVVAYTQSLHWETFSFWATGGLVSFERAIFVDNGQGSSLGFDGECASGPALGLGGITTQWSKALFLKGAAPFKFYDGGYHCEDCRWAELDALVTTRNGHPGNSNGLILERSAPLGWVDSDETDPDFSWVWDSGRVQLEPRTGESRAMIDFSKRFIQGTWQSAKQSVVTTDGLAGTVRGGAFTQWIVAGNAGVNDGFGPGARENPTPDFRQFYPCMPGLRWCGDGETCTAYEGGRDWPNAPWNR